MHAQKPIKTVAVLLEQGQKLVQGAGIKVQLLLIDTFIQVAATV